MTGIDRAFSAAAARGITPRALPRPHHLLTRRPTGRLPDLEALAGLSLVQVAIQRGGSGQGRIGVSAVVARCRPLRRGVAAVAVVDLATTSLG